MTAHTARLPSDDGARLQLHLVSESVAAAREIHAPGSIEVMVVGGDERFVRALEVSSDGNIAHVDGRAELSRRCSSHIAIVLLPLVRAAERVDLLRSAHRSVIPAGALIVVATVVAGPGEDRDVIPSMRQLLEELNDAAGLELHVDEIRSVRWPGERTRRGVIVRGTSLSVWDEG